MIAIAPIGPMRIAALQPAMPTDGSDPYEDGLDVAPVREQVPAFAPELMAPVEAPHEGGFDPQRQFGGNVAFATQFDRTPVPAGMHPPRTSFASPFARAMTAFTAG